MGAVAVDPAGLAQRARIALLAADGIGTNEIARRTGLHASSIRRILYDLARRLAVEQINADAS